MKLLNIKLLLRFFIIYFIITIFQVFFLYFIPLYYLDILEADPKELALTQVFPYLPLVISPLFGYIYDKYITKESQSKILFNVSSSILAISLFIFIFYKESLVLFGIITFLTIFSIYLIKTIMSNLYLHIVEKAPSNKRNLILILRITTILAYLTTSILFQIIIDQINLLELWNIFFLISFSLIIILLIFSMAINTKFRFLYHRSQLDTIHEDNSIYKKNPIMLFLYLAFFLGSSDLLFLYLFSSWILNKFGESSFKVYTFFLFLFPIGEILGNLLAYKYDTQKNKIGKEYDKKKLMFIAIFSYMFLMSNLTFSNFFMILMLEFGLAFTASIANFTYTSFITDILKREKNRTCKFQFLQTYNSLARMIFVPLSYLFYTFVKVEFLIITSVTLFGFSVAIIFLTNCIERKTSRNEIQLSQSLLDQNKITE